MGMLLHSIQSSSSIFKRSDYRICNVLRQLLYHLQDGEARQLAMLKEWTGNLDALRTTKIRSATDKRSKYPQFCTQPQHLGSRMNIQHLKYKFCHLISISHVAECRSSEPCRSPPTASIPPRTPATPTVTRSSTLRWPGMDKID